MAPPRQATRASGHLTGAGICGKPGPLECASCHLVSYCSKACQTSHWPEHRKDCKSELKSSWRPRWAREGRAPAFVGSNTPRLVPFGRNQYLWGNMPALDVLQLRSNEGEAYGKPLRLLFAASGDLRNVTKTVASLPETYGSQLKIDLNDRDMDIVARNLILLLLLYTAREDEADETVDCILHLWYSALIRQSCLDRLSQIRHLIEDVCSKITDKSMAAVLGKTWAFPNRKGSIRVVLTKEKWHSLVSYLEVPLGLDARGAEDNRARVTAAPERVDYVERSLFAKMKPNWRLCSQKFRQDGLLLPFGAPRHEFTVPNPTFFQTANEWPLKDSADPLEGWPLAEIFSTPSGARDDINGKLSEYIRSVLRAFHERTKTLHVDFQLYQGDVEVVMPMLSETYDRIEVSNICDGCYIGSRRTLELFGPLLRPPMDNPHGTLLALYLNAVEEVTTRMDEMQSMASELKAVGKYLAPGAANGGSSAEFLRFLGARNLVRDGDRLFGRIMLMEGFDRIGRAAGVEMKAQNTIVEPWPLKLKLRPGQVGAQEEFEMLLGSAHSGLER